VASCGIFVSVLRQAHIRKLRLLVRSNILVKVAGMVTAKRNQLSWLGEIGYVAMLFKQNCDIRLRSIYKIVKYIRDKLLVVSLRDLYRKYDVKYSFI